MSAVYSPHVKFLRKWGIRGSGDGEFGWPQGLVIDGGGNVYVSECSNDRIQVFDPQGRFLRKWGGEGSGDGEFIRPQDLAIDNEGNVYVSDRDIIGYRSSIQRADSCASGGSWHRRRGVQVAPGSGHRQ